MSLGSSRQCGAHGTALWLWSAASALLAAVLGLAACASEDHPDRRERGSRGEGGESRAPAGRPSLFVSPAGEPFRAGAGEPYPVAAWFRGADADGDGKLTRDEFLADAARFFKTLDLNHDGVIDGQELKAYETEVVPEITAERAAPGPGADGGPTFIQNPGGAGGGGGGGRRGRRGGGGGGMGPGGQQPGGGPGGGMPQAQGAAPYDLLAEREPVASADLDLNTRITLRNFQTKAAQRFMALDEDGKGYLLLQDLPRTQAQQGGRRGRGGRGQRPPGPPGQ